MPKIHRFNPYVPFPSEMIADFERIKEKHADAEDLSPADLFERDNETFPFTEEEDY